VPVTVKIVFLIGFVVRIKGSRKPAEAIGIAGTGISGRTVAINLAKSGFSVKVKRKSRQR
jgi:hypothetical protein